MKELSRQDDQGNKDTEQASKQKAAYQTHQKATQCYCLNFPVKPMSSPSIVLGVPPLHTLDEGDGLAYLVSALQEAKNSVNLCLQSIC